MIRPCRSENSCSLGFDRDNWPAQLPSRGWRAGAVTWLLLLLALVARPSLGSAQPAPKSDPTAGRGDGLSLIFEQQMLPKRPFVQQQCLYTLRVFYPPSLREQALSMVFPESITHRHLPPDRNFIAHRDGLRYRVLERKFALFAPLSGTQTLAGATFRGWVPPHGRRRLSLIRGEALSGVGSPSTIEVLPRPQDPSFENGWLPAASVTLVDSWSEIPPTFVLGVPQHRELRVEAEGVRAEQIRPLVIHLPPGVQIYRELPDLETSHTDTGLVARYTLRIAFVPTQTGRLILPEINLPWWNTRRARIERAQFMAYSTDVLANAGQANKPRVNGTKRSAGNSSLAVSVAPFYWGTASLSALCLWLLTILAWYFDSHRRSIAKPSMIRRWLPL